MIGRQIGPFRVLDRLGAGGMGEVYLAEDPRLGRRVALKSPSESWLQNAEARSRLLREARAAARLTHPRIAAVHDILEADGRPFIVMEFVEGETLSSNLRRGPLPAERAVALACDLADALAAAHAAGIVHRDLKPGNIILTPDGHLKVLDFGLAKAAPVGAADAEPASMPTSPGQLLGTPGYVAPEQVLGRPADARSDLYSAGAVLYEMLTGHAPFRQADAMGRALASVLEPVPVAHEANPLVPAQLSAIVRRAMARKPEDRYQSAAELRADLESVLRGLEEAPTAPLGPLSSRPRARMRWRAAVAACAVALAVAGLAAWWARSRPPLAAPPAGTAVVAVLPLENLSGDDALQHLGAGMAETMSTLLASVQGLSLIHI